MAYTIKLKTGVIGEAPWDGYTFGMDSDEGLALLGTPNGGATAWILMDHFAELGPRKPRVTVSTHGASYLCMLWYLADP